MNDRDALAVPSHRTSRDPSGRHKPRRVRLELEPSEALVLREILSKELHRIEAEIAGNVWQDLSESVLQKEALLRRAIRGLAV